MRASREIFLLLVILGTVFTTCLSRRVGRHKHLSKISHGHRKGIKKDAVQRDAGLSYNQFADAFNTNRLDAMDKDALSQLQDFNKHYLNNDEASETALLADHGIDDNAALKISNMASLPSEFAPGPSSNTASKTKIGNDVTKQAQPLQGNGNDEDAALLKDANSWPEYRFKDSDFSNYHVQEVVNNGPMNDQSVFEQPDGAYWQDEYGDEANTKPRLGKPEQTEEKKPASLASQAQKQDDSLTNGSSVASEKVGKSSGEGPSPDAASTAGQVANKSKNGTSTASSTSPAKQPTSPQSPSGPPSNLAANSPAEHEAHGSAEKPTADASTAGSQDKPGTIKPSQTTSQEAQGLKPPAETSKAIAKVLSGLVEGSVQNTKGAPAEVQGQLEGQAEHLDAQADGVSSSQALKAPKDAAPGINRPRSHTKEP